MAITLNLDTAEELNVTVRRGDTLSFDITVKDSDGDPIDLTVYNFVMDVRRGSSNTSRSDVVLSNRQGGSNTETASIVGAADGTLTVSAARTATNQIPVGAYLFDIAAVNPTASPVTEETWFYGSFTVNEDYSTLV